MQVADRTVVLVRSLGVSFVRWMMCLLLSASFDELLFIITRFV